MKISELPAAAALTGAEVLPIVQEGETRNVPLQPVLDVARKWADSIGQAPGGAGTKSALEHSLEAALEADRAETARDVAVNVGPYFATIAAGEAATAVDATFTVAPGDGTVKWYRRTIGGSAEIFDPNGFKAANGTKTRTKTARLREVVSLADYFSPGESLAQMQAAVTNAYSDGKFLEIPRGFDFTLTAAGSIDIPQNKGLVVGGQLTGTVYNTRFRTPDVDDTINEIHFEGGHFDNLYLHARGGTPRIFGYSGTGGYNVAHILIDGANGRQFRNVVIDGFDIRNAGYGVLENAGGAAGHSTVGAIIRNGQGHNLKGDLIEINEAHLCRNYLIQNHTIDLIDGGTAAQNPNWGIGIGVSTLYDFAIDNIAGSRLRQLCHVEYAGRFSISRVHGNDISSAYSALTGLQDVASVQVYGSDDFTIDGVTGDGSVLVFYGAAAGNYTNPPKSYALKNVDLAKGNIEAHAGREAGDARSMIVLENVKTRNGFIRSIGRASLNKWSKVTATRPRAGGQALILGFDYQGDNRAGFRSVTGLEYEFDDVNGYDEFGADSVGYVANASSPPSTTAGQGIPHFTSGRVQRRNCNWYPLNYGGVNNANIGTVNREFYLPCSGIPPYGHEFVPGDRIVCTNTGAAWLCISPGSRTRTGEMVSVVDGPTGVIKTEAGLDFTLPNRHGIGQVVKLIGAGVGGADLITTVYRAGYVQSATYRLQVADAITLANGTLCEIQSVNVAQFLLLAGPPRITKPGDGPLNATFGVQSHVIFDVPLTGSRTITLGPPSNHQLTGTPEMLVTRTAAATGAYNINIGSAAIQLTAASQWARVIYDGAATVLIAKGTL